MFKDSNGRRNSLTSRVAVAVSIAALLGFSVDYKAMGQSSKLTIDEGKRDIVQRVRQYPDSDINFENFDAVPMLIQGAKVKEIGNVEYHQLTGLSADSPKYTTFPNVNLTNRTDQRVTGLVLMIGNRQTKRIHGVTLRKLSIEPNESYSVVASDWVRPEKKIHITAAGKILKQLKPDLDSEKVWWSGPVGDLVLRVAAVSFENGSRWVMDSTMDW